MGTSISICLGRRASHFQGPRLANVSFAVTSKRFYLYPMVHNRRVFVDKVDFISVPEPQGPRARQWQASEGPRLCFALGGDGSTSSHCACAALGPEGHTVDEVLANTGFDLIVPERVPITEPPTEENWVCCARLTPMACCVVTRPARKYFLVISA